LLEFLIIEILKKLIKIIIYKDW